MGKAIAAKLRGLVLATDPRMKNFEEASPEQRNWPFASIFIDTGIRCEI
jgi:hypothetical protein